MSRILCLLVSAICLSQVVLADPNFVVASQADMAIVVHEALCTPNWVPGMIDTWETALLHGKQLQGLSVCEILVTDGSDQNGIKSLIDNASLGFQYVLLLGDSRDGYIESSGNPVVYNYTDYAGGVTMPFWKAIVPTPGLNSPEYSTVVRNDVGYVSSQQDCKIGRIPASSNYELLSYFRKIDSYLQNGSFSSDVLTVMNNCDDYSNGSRGEAIEATYGRILNEIEMRFNAHSRTTADLASSAQRVSEFESIINTTPPAVINALGTNGSPDNLVEFYFGNSGYNLTNTRYPFMFGVSCDIGGISHQWNGQDMSCVIENLLVNANGIIGAVAPTGPTWQRENAKIWQLIWKNIDIAIENSVGAHFKAVTESSIPGYSHAFTLGSLVLLSDPSIAISPSLKQYGTWHLSQSPIHVTEDVHIQSGKCLTIEAGVSVIADEGVGIILHDNAQLIVVGESGNPVTFECSAAGLKWEGITTVSVPTTNNIQINIANAIIEDAGVGTRMYAGGLEIDGVSYTDCNYGISLSQVTSASIENVTITDCPYSAIALLSVENTTVAGVEIDNCSIGVFAYDINVDELSMSNLSIENCINGGLYMYYCDGISSASNITIEECNYGVFMYHSDARFTCSSIQDNGSYGVYINYGLLDLTDNARSSLLRNREDGQIFFTTGGDADLTCGYNNFEWYDKGKYFELYPYSSTNPCPIGAEYNYWTLTTLQEIRAKLGATNCFDVDPFLSTETVCNQTVVCTAGDDPIKTLYSAGLESEAFGNATAALASYEAAISQIGARTQSKYQRFSLMRYIELSARLGLPREDVEANLSEYISEFPDLNDILTHTTSEAEYEMYSGNFENAASSFSEYLNTPHQQAVLEASSHWMQELIYTAYLASQSGGRAEIATIMPAEFRNVDFSDPHQVMTAALTANEGSLSLGMNDALPTSIRVGAPYPNPFNPVTQIQISIPQDTELQAFVYNLIGQKVDVLHDGHISAGAHTLTFNGSGLATGLYFIHVNADGKRFVRKVALVK